MASRTILLPTNSNAEWAWLAGLLEGEGTFGVQPKRGYPYISVAMKDHDIVRRCADLMGCRKIWLTQEKDHCSLWKAVCQGQRAMLVIDRIYPWLGERRKARIELLKQASRLLPGQVRGEQCARSRLTEVQVKEIRSRSANGESRKSLGLEFNVTPECVSAIVNKKTWTHLQDKPQAA